MRPQTLIIITMMIYDTTNNVLHIIYISSYRINSDIIGNFHIGYVVLGRFKNRLYIYSMNRHTSYDCRPFIRR